MHSALLLRTVVGIVLGAIALAACSESSNSTAASAPVCGDRVIGTGEQCDDANTAGNDGCAATCACEATHAAFGDAPPGLAIPDDGYNGTLASNEKAKRVLGWDPALRLAPLS